MIARIGLAAAVLLWIAGLLKPETVWMAVGDYRLYVQTRPDFVHMHWTDEWRDWGSSVPINFIDVRIDGNGYLVDLPDLELPGITVWDRRFLSGNLDISHWLLCLTFLVATVVTGWKRKRPASQPAETGRSDRAMKYWTLFTLRMIAQVGLATAVILWVVGQFEPERVQMEVEDYRVYAHAGTEGFHVNWLQPWLESVSVPTIVLEIQVDEHGMLSHDPDFQVPGMSGWTRRSFAGGIRFSHWLLCLMFLLATVATNWK